MSFYPLLIVRGQAVSQCWNVPRVPEDFTKRRRNQLDSSAVRVAYYLLKRLEFGMLLGNMHDACVERSAYSSHTQKILRGSELARHVN